MDPCPNIYSNPPVLCRILHAVCTHQEEYRVIGEACPVHLSRDKKPSILEQLLDAIASSVPPEGAPGGVLFAALMQAGFSFGDFQNCMDLLVSSGRLYKKGEVYFPAITLEEELSRR
jgi:hypothetical protein